MGDQVFARTVSASLRSEILRKADFGLSNTKLFDNPPKKNRFAVSETG